MRPFRAEIPPHVADVVRRLPPDLKLSMRSAIRALCDDPDAGLPLQRELRGLCRYRVRRFRIVYELDRRRRVLRIVAVGARRDVYEAVARLRKDRKRR